MGQDSSPAAGVHAGPFKVQPSGPRGRRRSSMGVRTGCCIDLGIGEYGTNDIMLRYFGVFYLTLYVQN